MKPESSLEPNEEPTEEPTEEPIWLPLSRVEPSRMGNLSAIPSKAVFNLLKEIEQGHFPIVFLDMDTNTPLAESSKAYEAYVRCHISIIPIIYKEQNVPDPDI